MEYEPRIVACIICRGTEETLPDCIRSLKAQGVDFLNVTLNQEQEEKLIVETCKEVDLPYQISKFEWCDDTGASRQFNLDQVDIDAYDWAIWVDSDDTIETAHGSDKTLRDVVKQAALDGTDVVWLWYHYASDSSGNPVNIFRRERAFRTALIGPNKLYWKGIIHEVLMNCDLFKGATSDDILIKHHPKQVDRKHRNQPQLEKAMREDPNNPRFIMYMAHHYSASGMTALAYQWYLKFAENAQANEMERWQAFHYAAGCARNLGLFEQAEFAASQAIAMFPLILEPYIEMAIINFYKRDYDKALYWFKQCEDKRKGSDLVFFNPMYVTNEKDIHKALTLGAKGLFKEAVKLIEGCAQRDPENLSLKEMHLKFREAQLRDDTIKGLKALCVALLRHGELEKLRKVVDVLPWWLEETPEESGPMIEGIARHTAITQVEPNQDFYISFEQGSGPWADEHNPRYTWIVEQCNKLGKNLEIVDIGGGKGTLAKLLREHGHNVLVVEPNQANCAALREAEIKYSPKFFEKFKAKQKFDVAVMTEYLEHVPDPQADFDKASDIAEYVIVTVPRPTRADFRENITQDHLRTFTINQLEKLITSKPGRRIEEFRVIQGTTLDMNNLGMTVSKRAWEKEAFNWKFFEAASPEEWYPHDRVPGGSELALREVASAIDRKGETAFVYYNGERCVYQGVPYRNFHQYPPQIPCDVLVSSRTVGILAHELAAKQKYLWAHDISYGDDYIPELEEKIQGVFLESEFHKQKWLEKYPWSTKTYIVGGGITGEFSYKKKEGPPKFVWASSPVRGLDRLLVMWGKILEVWPDATLDIFYGWEWFDKVGGDKMWPNLKRNVMTAVEALPGVTWRGRVSHEDLTKFLMEEATVWLYSPNGFEEVYCAFAVEAQAAGLLCLYRENGALLETVGDRGIPIPMDADDDSIVQLLKENIDNEDLKKKASEWAVQQTWDKVVDRMRSVIDDNKVGDTGESSS